MRDKLSQQQQQQHQQHQQQQMPPTPQTALQPGVRAVNEQQAALMQTIKSVVCSVLCLLLLANIVIYFFVAPPSTLNKNGGPAGPSASSSASLPPSNSSSTQTDDVPALSAESQCSIDRRWAGNLSVEEFRSKYRLQRPLVLLFENGSADWLASGAGSSWTLDSLGSHFGSYEALVGRPIDIVKAGGRGQEKVNFGQFMELIRNESAEETRYIFSREFFHSTHMDSTLKFPSLIGYNGRDHDLFFFLGGNGSGVAFHRHADAWNAVVSGRKRWFLYPGDKAPPGGVHHAFEPRDWLERVYTRSAGDTASRGRPIQCDLTDGEILYIPEGFYHATVNLAPTLAIGIQNVKPIGSLETLFYEMRNKHPTEIDVIAAKISKQMPHNTDVMHKWALSRKHQEKYQDAERLLERIIIMDPSFLVAILDLAEIKWKFFGKTLEAEALYKRAIELNPKLWEVHGKYGEFLAYQTGELERAVEELEQAANIRGSELVIWQLLRTIHDFAGNETGAAAAEAMIDKLSIIEDQLIDF